jgi:hypothetical protein
VLRTIFSVKLNSELLFEESWMKMERVVGGGGASE